MLYLEDYLELIEHLPQELRDRLTLIRENDLKVNNSCLHRDTKVKQFFAEAKKLSPEQKQSGYEDILKDYEETQKYANDKVQIAAQTHDIMIKLIQKLDGELEKFKLELEADHAGITEELERRSLELDADTRLDDTINNYLNNSSSSVVLHSSNFKDRRRSEHKQHQRHHPYQNNHHNNGYHVRAKLSQNHNEPDDPYRISNSKQMPQYRYQNGQGVGKVKHHSSKNISRQNSTATSPTPYGASLASNGTPPSVAGDHMLNGMEISGGHYTNNLNSFGNNSGFKTLYKNNLPYNQQHSALSAALSSTNTSTLQTISTMVNSSSVHNNKISNNCSNFKGADLMDPNSPLIRQDPLAAAASQAIAATQQLQQGRRTPSLKASLAAINAAGLGNQLDTFCHNNKQDGLAGLANRNALAPMSTDQQAFIYNQPYGKMDSNGNSSPLYVSVTKSGRPSKRPKHHASHLYPDESPTSISSDNSVFENSESISSAEFIDTSHVFGSASPSSLDYNGSRVSDQGSAFYHQRDETRYCTCRQISYGEMVACDNEECEIEWFHYGCVGITRPPEGKWYCPECSRKMGSQHTNHRAQSQPQKKRGRKEKSVFNTIQCVPKSHKKEIDEYLNDSLCNKLFSSKVPNDCKNSPCILGIDEAGRGPVLGPMVYAIAYYPKKSEEILAKMKFADSKELTEANREKLFEALQTERDGFENLGYTVKIISPNMISNSMLRRQKYNLNALSHDTAIDLIKSVEASGVKIHQVFVDTVGPAQQYKEKLQKFFPKYQFTVTEKADSKFPIVSAASVCAKVVRDRIVQNWKYAECPSLHLDAFNLGSGYPADPETKRFLEDSLDPVFGYPTLARFSWSTITKILDTRGAECHWVKLDDDAGLGGGKDLSKAQNFMKNFFKPRAAPAKAPSTSKQKSQISVSIPKECSDANTYFRERSLSRVLLWK